MVEKAVRNLNLYVILVGVGISLGLFFLRHVLAGLFFKENTGLKVMFVDCLVTGTFVFPFYLSMDKLISLFWEVSGVFCNEQGFGAEVYLLFGRCTQYRSFRIVWICLCDLARLWKFGGGIRVVVGHFAQICDYVADSSKKIQI